MVASIGEFTRHIGQGDWYLAANLLELAQQQTTRCDVRAYNTALSVCKASRKGWLAAAQFLEGLNKKELRPTVVSYGACRRTCERSTQWQRVFCLLQETGLHQIEISNVLVSTAINSCEAWQWKEVLQLLGKPKVEPDLISYSAAISACGKAKQWMLALCLLRESQNLALEVNIVTYNAAITACDDSWQRALQLFTECRSTMRRSIVSYNAVMAACETAHCWAWCLAFLDALATPDVVSFSTAISACGKAGEWRRALEVLSAGYATSSANAVALNASISACEKTSEWQQASLLLRRSQLARLVDSISFSASISACHKSGQWQEALQTFRTSMDGGFWNLMSLNAAISAVGSTSWRLATELTCSAQANVVTLTALVSASDLAWRKGLWLLGNHRVSPSSSWRIWRAARTAVARACGEVWVRAVHLLDQEDVVSCSLQVDVCEFENDAKTARILLARMEAMMDTLPWPNQPIQL